MNTRSTTKKFQLLKERDFGDQISAVFDFIKINFKTIFKLYLYYSVPFIILGTVLYLYGFNDMMNSESLSFVFKNTLMGQLFIAIGTLLFNLSLLSFISLYSMSDEPSEISPAMIWQKTSGILLPYIGASILLTLIIFVGLMLLIIPGIYLAIAFSLTLFILIHENRGIGHALDRSRELTKEFWWSTFGFFIVIIIIQALISYTLVFPLNLLTPFSPLKMLANPNGFQSENINSLSNIIITTLSNLLSYFIYMISTIAVAIRYFSLVETKEGLSLDREIDAMTEEAEPEA